jgi:hypothetical protein
MENIENLQDKSLEKQMIEKYISASEPRSREYGLLYSAMQYAANWQKEQNSKVIEIQEESFKELTETLAKNLRLQAKMYTEEEVKKNSFQCSYLCSR